MPTITKYILIANLAAYALQMFFGDLLVTHFALWPLGDYPVAGTSATVGFEFWQLLTSAFLHGGLFHLGLNMYALYLFGSDLERLLGSRYFLALFLMAVLVGSCSQAVVATMAAADGRIYPTVGASGGVFGILLAFGMLFPDRTIMLLFPPIPLPARVFVLLYGAFELVNGIMGSRAGIAHFAHLGGMVGGYLVVAYWRRTNRRRPWPPP